MRRVYIMKILYDQNMISTRKDSVFSVEVYIYHNISRVSDWMHNVEASENTKTERPVACRNKIPNILVI